VRPPPAACEPRPSARRRCLPALCRSALASFPRLIVCCRRDQSAWGLPALRARLQPPPSHLAAPSGTAFPHRYTRMPLDGRRFDNLLDLLQLKTLGAMEGGLFDAAARRRIWGPALCPQLAELERSLGAAVGAGIRKLRRSSRSAADASCPAAAARPCRCSAARCTRSALSHPARRGQRAVTLAWLKSRAAPSSPTVALSPSLAPPSSEQHHPPACPPPCAPPQAAIRTT
jgi:hypothetical protein